MSKFEAGERVRVYSADSDRGVFTAKVIGPYGDVKQSLIDVELSDGRRASYYRKQCRRLVKKPCPPQGERVECWGNVYCDGLHRSVHLNTESADSGRRNLSGDVPSAFKRTVHLVELKPGEVILDRAKLIDAWKAAGNIYDHYGLSQNREFNKLADALGLEGGA